MIRRSSLHEGSVSGTLFRRVILARILLFERRFSFWDGLLGEQARSAQRGVRSGVHRLPGLFLAQGLFVVVRVVRGPFLYLRRVGRVCWNERYPTSASRRLKHKKCRTRTI